MSHAVFVVSKHWGRALPIRLIAKTERDMMRVCLLGVFVVLLSGCGANNLDAPREFFLKRQIGSGVDFGLFKGDLTDHVASFHGFADDREACESTAELFNKPHAGRRTYFCAPLNE